MTVLDEIVEELRDMRKLIASVRKKQNGMLVTAKVKATQGDKVKLVIADGPEGEVTTPFLRLGQPAGKPGGGHSQYVKPGVGEPMLIISPGGEINEHSRVVPWGHHDDFPSPGTAENDGLVHAVGDAKLEVKNGTLKLTVAGVSMSMSGAGVAFAGGEITHDGKKIDKTHKHTDVEPGPGLTGPPQ